MNNTAALTELKILVERIKQSDTVKFEYLEYDVREQLILLAISDASFSVMPRERFPGGMALAFANPAILQGQFKLAVIVHHSGLLKRVVRLRSHELAKAIQPDFSLRHWLPAATT